MNFQMTPCFVDTIYLRLVHTNSYVQYMNFCQMAMFIGDARYVNHRIISVLQLTYFNLNSNHPLTATNLIGVRTLKKKSPAVADHTTKHQHHELLQYHQKDERAN